MHLHISLTTAMEAEGVEAGSMNMWEMSLHGLEGEYQVRDMHSVFPGDNVSMLIP